MAVDWWREYGEQLLPRPQPVIRPGWMLVGKPGFLEAGIPLTTTFPVDTRLGRLTIEARGRMWVDWGDGERGGPFQVPGAPWPDGTVRHVWTTSGLYDIVVTVGWTATWRLGEEGGVLTDLVTEGVIDDFEIRWLEAVRNR